MPTYTIDSAGSTLSATSGADSVLFKLVPRSHQNLCSGGAHHFHRGGANNASAVGAYLHGGAGADLFNLKSQPSAGNASLIGGGGRNILSGAAGVSELKLGADADSVRGVGGGEAVKCSHPGRRR